MKRAAGIEPALIAWKAIVLPLNYARRTSTIILSHCIYNTLTQF